MLDLILKIDTRLTQAHLAALEEKGLHLVRAMDHNTYRVRGETTASIADIAALSFVEDVQEFAAMDKVDARLQQSIRTARAVTTAGDGGAATPDVRVLVALEKAMDTDAAVAALAQIGTVEEHSDRRALVTVAPERIRDVAQVPGVLSVEKEPDPRTQNNIARGLTHVEPIANDLGLDGAGEIVGVADSGLDTGVAATVLADFAGRVVNIRATVNKAAFGVADGADLNNHGTHVSGSILGDGSLSNSNLRGMAPAAEVTMLSMGPDNSTGLMVPADLTTGVFQDAYNDGARIHNNSWGSNGQDGQYTALSDDVDTFVRDNPDMLILIAAGNAGPNVGTVSPPGTAKNALTVGAAESLRPLPAIISINPNLQDDDFNPATPLQNEPLQIPNFDQQADDTEEIAVFSGRGPTDDGRIKPDLVAPGSWILSCRSSVSTADVGPDGLPHAAFGPAPPYADDSDGVASHAEAVGRGLPGAPFFGTWNQNTPPAPAGSGALAQDNYLYESGTSMATPITAGAATLLRQYLRERRGHTDPSAALLKALLVNGATVPVGDSNVPDTDRGFGWLNMANTLTPAPTNQQTYSDDIDLAVATSDVRQFSVQLADPSQPFRVTLAWSDAPGANLQNQLYLRVIDPATNVFDGDVTAFPNANNNVQRVHIDAPMAGTYTVEVHGIEVLFGIDAHLPAIRQDFALAVINGIGFSPEPVDVCQVVDRSGSMAFYGYMDPVKERAKQFVDLLRINDRSGVVSYNHAATTDHAVVPIAGLATQDAIKTEIDNLVAGGNTSIGGGLEAGRAAVAAGGDPSHPQALVLLSDGHENTPPWVGGGVTDSPPAWYGGPDFTEILP
ncbi:MAG: S8 family serine peptidase, partial [Rhodothermales bacterium]